MRNMYGIFGFIHIIDRFNDCFDERLSCDRLSTLQS